MTKYLSHDAIEQMADAALNLFEWACCWRQAGAAAREFAKDDLGVVATTAQVGLAVRLAQTRWQGISQAVKREVAA